MNYSKEIFVSGYFDIHNFYKKYYGIKTIILMQVGSFFECYATDTLGLGKKQLTSVAEDLNVIVTMKNKNKDLSKTNSYMIGFPIYTIDDFTSKLISLGYHVIVIDQVNDKKPPKREITGIYSPTTYIDSSLKNSQKNNNLICIYIDALRLKSLNNKKPLLAIGISSYDLTTGNGFVYETKSKKENCINNRRCFWFR